MLDYDLANVARFPDDFSKSQFATLNESGDKRGFREMRHYIKQNQQNYQSYFGVII